MGCCTQAHECPLKQTAISSSCSSLTICPIDSSNGAVNGTDLSQWAANNPVDWEVTSSTRNISRTRFGFTLWSGWTRALKVLQVPNLSLHFSVRYKVLCLFFCPSLEWVHCDTEWQSVPAELEWYCASATSSKALLAQGKGRPTIVALHSRRAETWITRPVLLFHTEVY